MNTMKVVSFFEDNDPKKISIGGKIFDANLDIFSVIDLHTGAEIASDILIAAVEEQNERDAAIKSKQEIRNKKNKDNETQIEIYKSAQRDLKIATNEKDNDAIKFWIGEMVLAKLEIQKINNDKTLQICDNCYSLTNMLNSHGCYACSDGDGDY